MSREDAKKILGEGATEEQITNFLNALHTREQALKNEIANKNNELEKYSDYDIIKSQLDEINKSKMTEQEKHLPQTNTTEAANQESLKTNLKL